ncbi:hypothetical protein HPB50_011184 [Hyalomma asiaticum]|uniref:Uncharacterized protein n=1 Tax=Hyalomma asiaticum TaxID=266040 RepID=A0ACB7RQW0_HYAAI|nr:hypothetical protein HPB50_011184 [Hyalomma asiaticum]
MDEFGSSIQHDSCSPSFRCVPFYQLPQREAYSILFPIRDVACGGEVTRDYGEGPPCDPLTRAALLIPWEPCDLTHVDCCPPAPRLDFLRSGRKEETEPDPGAAVMDVPRHRKLRVYSDYGQVRQCLTHPSFELVDEEKDADVLWLNYHFKQYSFLSDGDCKAYTVVGETNVYGETPVEKEEGTNRVSERLGTALRKLVPLPRGEKLEDVTILKLQTYYNIATTSNKDSA